MKKSIVQDVIPPRRTIRNVELPNRPKHIERPVQPVIDIKKADSEPDFEVSDKTYRYEYDEPVKHSKKTFYFAIGVLILAVVFGVSAFFKSAEIKITPRSQILHLDELFKANKDTSAPNDLGFQIVTTSKDIEKTVSATDEQNVQKKATGKIIVYNNFSTETQRLIATTRFETPEGLIFRAIDAVNVPGIQQKNGKPVAGSAEVTVEADKPGGENNIGMKDFTVVGFKGTTKYSKIYARSKTEMTGGFSGVQKVVSSTDLAKFDSELTQELKDALSRDIISQIPENYVLYEESIQHKLEPTAQVYINSNNSAEPNSAILRKKGSISAIIFDKGTLTRMIVSKTLPDLTDDLIKIVNLDSLVFSIPAESTFDQNTSTVLNFSLKGEVNLVWVFDENKLETELLGLSKRDAVTVISSYENIIKEANIKTRPFWNTKIPNDPGKVALINTLESQ